MESNAKGRDIFNKSTLQIANMNMEIMLFLEKFTKFQKNINIIDNKLSSNLHNVVDHIERFLDGNPRPINPHNQIKVDVNFERHCLERIMICNLCQVEVGDNYTDITRHIAEPFHKNVIQNGKMPVEKNFKSKKERKQDKIAQIKKKTEKQNLPKKAKSFITESYESFLDNSVKEANIIRNMPEYGNLEKSLLSSIYSEFPMAKIHFFGSRISGLGTHDSDLDIFIDVENVFNCYQENRDVIVNRLKKVRKILNIKRAEWKNIIAIEDARVPIIRAFNFLSNIDCDIGFSNGLGTCNTRLIKYFCEIQPIFQKMCIFLKKWLHYTALSKQLSTYTVTLLVVYYLQSKELLPSVAELQNDVPNPTEIGPWMANFTEKSLDELEITLEIDGPTIFDEHMRKFFNYYANFSFTNLLICPFLGKAIEKKNFTSYKASMPRYFKHYNTNPTDNIMLLDKPMCIQDPFEQNHNVAKGVTDRLLILIRRFLLLSGQEFGQK